MEYYSALKKKEILSYATTWMNFKDIMLSEISQSQKDKYHRIPLKVDKFTDTKSRTVLSGTAGRVLTGNCLVSVIQNKKF